MSSLQKNYCKASEKSVKGEDDHDIVFGTLIIVIPPIKKNWEEGISLSEG